MPSAVFNTVGSHDFDVPDGVDLVRIEVWGAQGADRASEGDPGLGGYATGILPVTPGETLGAYVGGVGDGLAGGWNGGADGGTSQENDGGGGGGASDIRQGGTSHSDRVLVGAGGGGTSGYGNRGGDGGADTGQGGGSGYGDGGSGGTQTEGGDDDGSFGDGGDGGSSSGYAGGGGGGGWYGGGGGEGGGPNPGDFAGGGGGGSNYVDASLSDTDSLRGEQSGDGEIRITWIEAPQTLAVVEERESELDLELSAVDDADEYRIYRHDETNPYANGSLIATIDSPETTFTDTGLTNGKQYHYQVTAYNTDLDEESEPSDEATGTTLVNPTEIEAITPEGDRDIRLSLTKADNNPDGGFEVFRSQTEGELGDSVATLDASDDEYLDEGLSLATTYYYTLRRDTTDVTADSVQIETTTGISPPDGVTVDTDAYDTRLVVSWSDSSGGEAQHNIRVYGDGSLLADHTVETGVESVTTDDIVPNRANTDNVDVVVESDINGSTAAADPVTVTIATIDFAEENYTVVFRLGGELTQLNRRWDAPPTWRSEPSAITSWGMGVPEDTSLEELTRADIFVWFSDELLLRGEFNDISTTDSTTITDLAGDDIIKTLERGGASVTFEAIEVAEAIRQYASEHLAEWTVTVHDPEPDQIDEDLIVQNAETTAEFEEIFDLEDDDPFVIEDDALKQLPSAVLQNGTDNTQGDNGSQGDQYTGNSPSGEDGTGFAVELDTVGETRTWEFETAHTYPEDAVGMWIRAGNSNGTPETVINLDGNELTTLAPSNSATRLSFGWTNFAEPGGAITNGWTGGDLEAGTHTLEVEITDPGDEVSWDGETIIDHLALVDNRFDFNFDDDVTFTGTGNRLDGPEEYADAVRAVSETFDQSFNIDKARLTTVWNDTSENQALQVSNDGTQTWHPSTGFEENTDEIIVDFDTVGTTITGGPVFSRHSPDGAQDVTPRYGYAGQQISSWELAIWTNTTPVLDEKELVGSHFENLQRLHNEGGMVFWPGYDEESLQLESAIPGQIEANAEWTRLDYQRTLDVSDYANSLTVYGAVDEEEGSRLEATAQSVTEIERIGEVVPGTLEFRPEIESEEQLRNIARVELSQLIAEDNLTGTIDIVPKPLQPGKSYPVPALRGEYRTLWGLEFSDTRRPRGSLEFGAPDDLAAALTSVRVDVRETKAIL